VNEDNPGLVCPACHHPRSRTLYTRRKGGASVRVRVCAHCSHRFRTAEEIVSVTAPSVPSRGRRKRQVQ
jgi:transcriptional regulator NrdR family protein